MITICIIGATGNIGTETLFFLYKARSQGAKFRIIAAVQNIPKAEHLFTSQGIDSIEFRTFDITKPDKHSLERLFTGIDVLLLVRPPQISDVPTYIHPLIDCASKAGVQHIVFLSLYGVEQQTRTPHYAIEQYLRQSKCSWTFLRPSFFMQNLTTTHRHEIAEEDCIFIPAGDGRTNFIDGRDIGEVAARVLLNYRQHRFMAYTLTGEQSYTYHEIAAKLSSALGRTIRYKRPNKLQFLLTKWLREREPLAFVLVMIYLYHQTINGNADVYSPTIQEILGRKATSFDDFVLRHKTAWEKTLLPQ